MSSLFDVASRLFDAVGHVPFLTSVLTKGSLLVLLAVVLTRLLARAPASARHLIWSLSVAGLLLLPATAWIPWRLELPLLASARDALDVTTLRASAVATTPAPTFVGSGRASSLEPLDLTRGDNREALTSTRAAPSASTPSGTRVVDAEARSRSSILGDRRFTDPGALAVMVWFGGVLWMLGRLAVGMASVRWMLRRATPLAGTEWRALLDGARASLGARPVSAILLSERAAMPFTYGLFRPVIVLPPSAGQWSIERRRSVLLHELAHIRRGDLLTNAVVQFARAVYWFHPLVWFAARRVCIEAERACDALVLGAGMRPSDYAGDLLEIARDMRSSAAGAVALAMARRSDFEGRLLAILAPDSGGNVLTAARATLLALLFAAPAVAVAAAVPPRAVVPPTEVTRAEINTVPEESSANATPTESHVARASDGLASRILRLAAPAVVSSVWTTAAPLARASEGSVSAPIQSAVQSQGRDTAVPALLSVVRDEDATVRLAAVHALGELQDPRAIDALAEVLRTDSDARVRETAAWALGEIDSPRAVPALIAALGSERVTAVRAKIVWALGEIEDTRAVEALGTALRDESKEVRHQAVWALGEIESPTAVPWLIPLLRDSDVEVRKQAAWALGEIESPDAVTALSAATKDADLHVREQAVWALGEIEDSRALPALVAALGDPEPEIRRKAIWAIGEIDDIRSAPPELIAALRDTDREVRKGAAEALAEMQDTRAVPALIPLTRDSDAEVKRAAVHALSEIGGANAIEAIVALLKDDDPEIRKMAIQALGKNR